LCIYPGAHSGTFQETYLHNSPSIRCNNCSIKHYEKESKREGKVMTVYLSCLTVRRLRSSLVKYQQLAVSSSKRVGARVHNASPACTLHHPRVWRHGAWRCEPVQRHSVCRRVIGRIQTCNDGQHTRRTDRRRRRHRGGQCSLGR
jgi:hypothetical protein